MVIFLVQYGDVLVYKEIFSYVIDSVDGGFEWKT